MDFRVVYSGNHFNEWQGNNQFLFFSYAWQALRQHLFECAVNFQQFLDVASPWTLHSLARLLNLKWAIGLHITVDAFSL